MYTPFFLPLSKHFVQINVKTYPENVAGFKLTTWVTYIRSLHPHIKMNAFLKMVSGKVKIIFKFWHLSTALMDVQSSKTVSRKLCHSMDLNWGQINCLTWPFCLWMVSFLCYPHLVNHGIKLSDNFLVFLKFKNVFFLKYLLFTFSVAK